MAAGIPKSRCPLYSPGSKTVRRLIKPPAYRLPGERPSVVQHTANGALQVRLHLHSPQPGVSSAIPYDGKVVANDAGSGDMPTLCAQLR